MDFEKLENLESLYKRRLVVFDTETTGIGDDHRVVEIGAVEIDQGKITGKTFHEFVDPEREVDMEAEKVHGWDRESLIQASSGRKFEHIAKKWLTFTEGAVLVAHNASFDIDFMNKEFQRLSLKSGFPNYGEAYQSDTNPVFDTLAYARSLPGKKNTLDALAREYKVDNSERDLHGALLDSEILAQVFLKMVNPENNRMIQKQKQKSDNRAHLPIRKTPVEDALDLPVIEADPKERQAHQSMKEGKAMELTL